MKDNQNTSDEISWTEEELQKWVEAGLIPQDLLAPTRWIELHNHIREKKEVLQSHYHRNFDNDHYQCQIPPPSEWHNAPDIKVIDRRTGEVVSILEMGADFKLFDGLCLKIKAKELQQWEQETAEARKFNEEQKATFIATLQKIGPERPLSRKEIVTLIEEVRKPPKSKTFRQSRELIDNKLDRSHESKQLTIFDFYDSKSKALKDVLSEEKPIIKGLDLDQAEDRIIHTLTLLLSRNSESQNQNSEDYYMGNQSKGIVSINNIEMETARMLITPHEFYSTYYGKDHYGQDQVTFLLNKLDSLSKKNFLTSWTIPSKKKGKFDKFRTYLPLFQIAILNHDLTESESQEIDNNRSLLEGKKCLFLFKFQPQFTNNIRERYVEFPEDIHLRIAKAAGKDRYSQCINLMRDFLFREKQHKRYEIVRDKETLIEILNLAKFWKEGRKKRVNELINECFEVFLKLGLLEEWEETQGKQGQPQFYMKINKDFK